MHEIVIQPKQPLLLLLSEHLFVKLFAEDCLQRSDDLRGLIQLVSVDDYNWNFLIIRPLQLCFS